MYLHLDWRNTLDWVFWMLSSYWLVPAPRTLSAESWKVVGEKNAVMKSSPRKKCRDYAYTLAQNVNNWVLSE